MGIFVKKRDSDGDIEDMHWGRTIGAIITVAVIVWLLVASITIVPAGHVGVHDLFGSVSPTEYKPGIHLKNPFAAIKMMSVKTQEYTMSYTKGEGAKRESDIIQALTKEGLTVGLDITILYKLTPSEADVIYKTIGEGYVSVVVRPLVRTVIREVVARYEAKQIYSEDRVKASEEIFDELTEVLAERGIIVESTLLRHVQLPAELTKAIEAKLTAEQNIEKKQFEVQVEEQEAERKRIEAQGIADAQDIIDETLTPEYLKYLLIVHLKEYEGGKIFIPTNLDLDFVYDMND